MKYVNLLKIDFLFIKQYNATCDSIIHYKTEKENDITKFILLVHIITHISLDSGLKKLNVSVNCFGIRLFSIGFLADRKGSVKSTTSSRSGVIARGATAISASYEMNNKVLSIHIYLLY